MAKGAENTWSWVVETPTMWRHHGNTRRGDTAQGRAAAVRTLVSSVLPTPVGPAKSMAAMGRRGSLRPERARRIARATAPTASVCPITFSCLPHQRHISNKQDATPAAARQQSGTEHAPACSLKI